MFGFDRLFYTPTLASAHGGEIDRLLIITHAFMIAFFAGWLLFGTYILFRFRRRKNPKADYHGARSHASHYLEVGVVVFEIVLLVAFAIPFWSRQVAARPEITDDTVEVRVLAQQFAWNVHYPGEDGIFGRTAVEFVNDESNPVGLDPGDPNGKDDIVALNRLAVPVNRPVVVWLTAKDVIHSFALPEMRVKQDAIPGMQIPVRFTATMTSREFRAMKADMSIEAFDAWAAELTPERMLEIYQQEGDAAYMAIQQKLERTFEIACAQLCGLGHYRMRGFLNVFDEDDYAAWLEENKPGSDPFADPF